MLRLLSSQIIEHLRHPRKISGPFSLRLDVPPKSLDAFESTSRFLQGAVEERVLRATFDPPALKVAFLALFLGSRPLSSYLKMPAVPLTCLFEIPQFSLGNVERSVVNPSGYSG